MWKLILSAMLFLMAPGKSIYSQVVVPEGAPRPCDDPYSLLCLAPHWSEAHGAHTVAENWTQGVQRYSTIARALADVIEEKERSAPHSQLWRYVVAFAYHESGFRRDVHSGIGSAARGDCRWRTVKRNGKEKRERVPGSCRSHCLAQIMLGPVGSKARTSEGYAPSDLTGLDMASTQRCMRVAVRIIEGAWRWCSYRGERPLALCIVKHYAGGMIASRDPRVLARIKTVNKLDHAPTRLEREVLLALGIHDTLGDDEELAADTPTAMK